MTPQDLNLPAKFTEFRTYAGFDQLETAIEIAASDKRFNLLSAPPGAGKSLIYMTVARLLEARALILVGTKGLQNQLLADFKSVGMSDVRGQSNYRCVALDSTGYLSGYGNTNSTCTDGPCHVGVFCPLSRGGCYYYDAVAAARNSQIVVSNYSYWMHLGKHGDEAKGLGEFDLIILDEAHTAPEWLNSFCAVDLHRSEIKDLIGLSLPPINEGVKVWSSWAKTALVKARERYIDLKKEIGDKRKITRKLLRLNDIGRELKELSKAHEWQSAEGSRKAISMPGMHTDWVAEETIDGARFSPVWAHAYAEEYLYRGAPRVLLSSATLTPDIVKYLGIKTNYSDYHEVQSGFNPAKRPFIFISTQPRIRVDWNISEVEWRALIRRIDDIIDQRLDRKGIIHCRSYDRAQEIISRSRHAKIMMTHSTRSTREVVARFKASKGPALLVSPSVEEGFDFPGEQCTYQIIIKVPFINTQSPLMKARVKSDKGYRNYMALMSIIQMSGRGNRSETDVCETFIMDDHWNWFRAACKWPKWFKKAWKQMDVAPKPPELT